MTYELILSNGQTSLSQYLDRFPFAFFLFIMDGNGKKPLKIVIAEFYKLHKAKGKEYTFKQFKKFGVHKATFIENLVLELEN